MLRLFKLLNLKNKELTEAATEFIAKTFVSSHPLYAALYDLQALDVVRIVEGKDE